MSLSSDERGETSAVPRLEVLLYNYKLSLGHFSSQLYGSDGVTKSNLSSIISFSHNNKLIFHFRVFKIVAFLVALEIRRDTWNSFRYALRKLSLKHSHLWAKIVH